jgi:hypothetical protein
MRFRWPTDTVFNRVILEVEQDSCSTCGHSLHVCDHRPHRIFTMQGPVELLCKLAHCPSPRCAAHTKTLSPQAELLATLPGWMLGWDVFSWLGHRRFARHWSVPQLRLELADSYHIPLSADAIEVYLRRYQTMLAARQQDSALLAQEYHDVPTLTLSIDGLQPEKGHETLYVVRELQRKRVWFAEALLSSSTAEVGRLLQQAQAWAKDLGKPIALWLSDKQDAFVKGIAAHFPDVPHRYCSNHFLRDLAKPILENDSHAKVQLRTKVRGLRAIEREVLQQNRSQPPAAVASVTNPMAGAANAPVTLASSAVTAPLVKRDHDATPATTASAVVLDYCAAVRGILNDDQGGPLHPPGLRMADALGDVHASLQRNVQAKKGGALTTC